MARGGFRPGAGRPGRAIVEPKPVPADIRAAAKACRLSPLDYMLGVLNDEDAAPERRDRMAQAAAPYVHAKPSVAPGGKKAEAEEAAQSAGAGSEWGADLAYRPAN